MPPKAASSHSRSFAHSQLSVPRRARTSAGRRANSASSASARVGTPRQSVVSVPSRQAEETPSRRGSSHSPSSAHSQESSKAPEARIAQSKLSVPSAQAPVPPKRASSHSLSRAYSQESGPSCAATGMADRAIMNTDSRAGPRRRSAGRTGQADMRTLPHAATARRSGRMPARGASVTGVGRVTAWFLLRFERWKKDTAERLRFRLRERRPPRISRCPTPRAAG
ncbi:hypothetical protein ruthe_02834 [Rubellimicrobium thermophilum DSM 16684]|uniref:Uncharacterized protein n=1 Tax=Rubellimicrobium thermophilum DSM 16684 TaxID=1123069 RepID=S9RYW8_9RHOB|nr:hypothetical protein ruthe_02834 [Rubellimicrobium thermophilum DSM 16684]